MNRAIAWIVACGTAAASLGPVLARPAAADPLTAPADTLGLAPRALLGPSPRGGFLDDPMAFDDAGGRLAYVRTDESTFCELVVHDLASGADAKAVQIAKLTVSPERLVWLPGDRIAVVAHDADAPSRTLGVFDLASGALVERLGPATDFGFPRGPDGSPRIVAWTRAPGTNGGAVYTIEEYSNRAFVARPAPAHRLQLAADGQGIVASLGLQALFWTDGYRVLVAKKKGEYDKARDIRRPDRAARYDVLDRKILDDHEIEDVIAYAKLLQTRERRPLAAAFLTYNDDLTGLELVRRDDSEAPVAPQLPVELYDHASLRQMELPAAAGGGDRLYFSLTIDPVNPRAVARRKADKDLLDLYVLSAGDGGPHGPGPIAAALAGRVPAEGRPCAWIVGRGRFALLRKHVGFDRGGDAIEVYDLPAGAVSVTQAEIPAHPGR